jgi:hypothetical protein
MLCSKARRLSGFIDPSFVAKCVACFLNPGGVAPKPGRKRRVLGMAHVSSFAVGAAVNRQAAIVDAARMVDCAQVVGMPVLAQAPFALLITQFGYGARSCHRQDGRRRKGEDARSSLVMRWDSSGTKSVWVPIEPGVTDPREVGSHGDSPTTARCS